MHKETFLQRLFTKLMKKTRIFEEYEVDKAEMCRKAVASGVCPNTCDICAWNSTK